MTANWIIIPVTITWLIVCAVLDARHGEVPNWLTLPGMAAGIIYSLFMGWERAAITAAAFIGLMLLFMLRSLGGADVKVLTGLAGFWPAGMIAAFIMQGIWGAVVMIIRGRGSEFRAIPSYAVGALLSLLLLV